MLEAGALGKKVFFLYPAPVLGEVVDALANREFEVYLVRDHERLRKALAKAPDAIVFINLDDGLDEAGWEGYVKALKAESPTVGLGVLTLNDDPTLREKYLMELQIPCGFVIMKIGAAKAAEILVKTLDANEARGRRKFVRATCPPGTGKVNIETDGLTIEGSLTDISSAGMAVAFDGGADFAVGTVLRGLSVSVKGLRLIASGIVVAKRKEASGESIHVLMFDPNSLDESRRGKLKNLVFRLNQATMERMLEQV